MLTVYTLEQSINWDSVVRSFAEYDVYWLSGYVKAFHINGDGEPLLFFYENIVTRGINVVMKRDVSDDPHFFDKLPRGQYYDFSTPYGYGGWLIEGNNTEELFDVYEKWCVNNGIISEFVRFHPIINNHLQLTVAYDVIPLGETIVLDLSSPEVIWDNISRQKHNRIRKAQKNGIRVYLGQYPDIYKDFRDIYNETMDRDNADAYYYFTEEFYKSILNDLPHNAQVFYAVWNDKIIAASIILMANGHINYHLAGSLSEYQNFGPSNLLVYEVALWGCANGYKTLHLGGGVGSSQDSLFRFKHSFNKSEDLNRFCIGRRIYLGNVYQELVDKRDEVGNDKFFPVYRG